VKNAKFDLSSLKLDSILSLELRCYLLCNPFICCNPTISIGLLDKLRRKKDENVERVKGQTTPQPTHPTNAEPPPGRGIKKYTSEGKQIYE
jgi:hypothetical protein